MTICITAKCSDMFNATVLDEGQKMGEAYLGYVPDWFPNPKAEHYGDYVQLQIDVVTGKILNWKKPTNAQIEALIMKRDDES